MYTLLFTVGLVDCFTPLQFTACLPASSRWKIPSFQELNIIKVKSTKFRNKSEVSISEVVLKCETPRSIHTLRIVSLLLLTHPHAQLRSVMPVALLIPMFGPRNVIFMFIANKHFFEPGL